MTFIISSWILITIPYMEEVKSRTIDINLYNLRMVNIFRFLKTIVFKPVKKHFYFKYKETHACKQVCHTLSLFLKRIHGKDIWLI